MFELKKIEFSQREKKVFWILLSLLFIAPFVLNIFEFCLFGGTVFTEKTMLYSFLESKYLESTEPSRIEALSLHEQGLRFYEQGDYTQAEIYYQKAIQKDPELAIAHNNLGIILSLTKRTNEAYVSYEKAIRLSQGEDFVDHDELGMWDTELNHNENAISVLEPNAYNNLGMLYIENQQYEKAISAFELAISLNSNLNRPYKNLGDTYWALDDKIKAKSYYQKAVEHGAKGPIITERLVLLHNN